MADIQLRILIDGDNNQTLQFRKLEGPRGEEWWSDWKDVPVISCYLANDKNIDYD